MSLWAQYQSQSIRTPDGATLHYLMLGRGPRPVVVIPGAGDGLQTLDRAAGRLALYFARRARDWRLLVFSRRQPLPAGFGLEGHARDLLWLLEQLSWPPTLLECNSAGGPVGQLAARERPGQVRGLVLSCTLHRSQPATRAVLEHWLGLAAAGRWADFQWSSIEHTFRPATVRRYRPLRPFLRFAAPPPRDPSRIRPMLAELLDFDHRSWLPELAVPALVIGGEDDRVIPAEIQREMAALIPGSELKLYPGFGHGNDQENPDYERQVAAFAQRLFAAAETPDRILR
jgi:pimeloyl-ACP methyl ester carboxylesterase